MLSESCCGSWRWLDRILCCPGLHPSQQLTKYDGEAAPAGVQNGAAYRLSSQGSGDSGDGITATSDLGAPPPTSQLRVDTEAPAQDLTDLYSKPIRMTGRREVIAEPLAASDQSGDTYLQDSRKFILTGNIYWYYSGIIIILKLL